MMGVAFALWAGVFVYLLRFDDIPPKTYLTSLGFMAFFAVAILYYGRTAIVVDGQGVTYRGMFRTARFGFDDIRRVDVLPGPLTIYAIRGRDRLVHFSSFFRSHQRLATMLMERAQLSPA